MGRSQINTWNVGGVRFQFPFGQTMPTQIILDYRNPSKATWLIETRCYALKGCRLYQAGSAYHIPSRRSRMVYVGDDAGRARLGIKTDP
jgi:hypothetical protein